MTLDSSAILVLFQFFFLFFHFSLFGRPVDDEADDREHHKHNEEDNDLHLEVLPPEKRSVAMENRRNSKQPKQKQSRVRKKKTHFRRSFH